MSGESGSTDAEAIGTGWPDSRPNAINIYYQAYHSLSAGVLKGTKKVVDSYSAFICEHDWCR